MTTETFALPTERPSFSPIQSPWKASCLLVHCGIAALRYCRATGKLVPFLEFVEAGSVKIAVISCSAAHSGLPDMTALRTPHLTHPEIPKICLMETESREVAVRAFRSGARGLFSLADSSFQLFCECIERVHRGEIFATTEQLNYLLESVYQVPSLRVVGASGEKLLTSREEQVVALVTDGLSN